MAPGKGHKEYNLSAEGNNWMIIQFPVNLLSICVKQKKI